ncbi:uncharacterized protein GGS25DRAFT_481651 [Hypoxylon fragiforme]|uniref:uncharacterized protein n=1 Tax=Hypoxylon fragiforme TaxID=63214 RepID=UPI0020C74267|nr:uncharacterized protein GGS25DRAFT_481651 [Hypoxylon fragiforme]KAI2611160.1 hypothetical protein GGS25DRAFT_481651 [Hypoxylon fragiforme]
MESENLPQSLGFLTDAAHLLTKSAPETSAYLIAQRNSLMFNHELEQSDIQRQHICGACGHIMISGQGSQLKIETNKAIHKRGKEKKRFNLKNPGEKKVGCRKRFTCGMCSRYTDISIPPAAPISKRRPLKSKPSTSSTVHTNSSAAPLTEPPKVSANASSKKRAKSRKQGLQALLQQAQSSKPQNGLGLSLSDFMMK